MKPDNQTIKLPTEKTGGKVKLSKIRMLLYGPPKIGKSTVASGFPDTIFLATEKCHDAMSIYKVDIPDWKTFKKYVEVICEGKHKYKTIVVDTIDILFNLCVSFICTKLNIIHISDEDWGKGYDIVAKEFEGELNKLFLTDYGIIMLSHSKYIDTNNRMGKSTKLQATLPNQARRIVLPKVSVIGAMGLKQVDQKGGGVKEVRCMTFAPSEFVEAGDANGVLPDEIISFKDPAKTYEAFKQAYNKQ